jgi:hypothetical protein
MISPRILRTLPESGRPALGRSQAVTEHQADSGGDAHRQHRGSGPADLEPRGSGLTHPGRLEPRPSRAAERNP